jgi:DNA helicase II / ATP-dependent DNA helicase PcrA
MSYSPQQISVIESDAKRLAVLAGAGSGKTFTMVGKVNHLITISGISPRNIALITFTNDAAESLVERLETLGCSTEGITTKTLHSFCYELLRTLYNFTGRDRPPKIISSPNFFMGTFWKLVKTYDNLPELHGRKQTKMPHKSWNQYYKFIYEWQMSQTLPEAVIADLFSMSERDFKRKMLATKDFYTDNLAWAALWYLEYESWKTSTKQMDFNDIILICLRELKASPARAINFIKNKYKVIITDECQDNNHLIVQVLKLITTPDTQVILVGDIRQAIYSFMGASPSTIMDYINGEGFEQLNLNGNYRSSKEIIENANFFVGHYPSFNIGGDNVATKPAEGYGVKRFVSDDEVEESKGIFRKLQDLKSEGFNYKDLCVLFRTNSQAMLLLQYCVMENIPFSIKKDCSSIFDRSEMKDILAYLKILNELDSTKLEDFKRIINKPTRYIPNATLESATRLGKDDKGFGRELLSNTHHNGNLDKFCENMRHHIRHCKKLSISDQINYIMGVIGYGLWWETSDDKDKFFDLNIYCTSLTAMAQKVTSYRELIKEINKMRKAIREQNSEDGINFTTIHSSKGLEWPVCIVMGVCDRLYPFYRAREESGMEGVMEEARLFYVASTRPERRLYYSEIKGTIGKVNVSTSPFIFQTQSDETFL